MASSSGLQSICSNTECRKVMEVPRQGWRCVDRNVDLCNQCFIAFRTKQFCDIYHKNLNNWSICKFCEKKIHRHCIVSRCWYKKLKGGGIKCNGCAPPDAILISNSRETMHNTTSKAAPRACVPQKLVANDQMTNEEYVSETSCERSTSPPLALEYYGSKSPIEAQAQVEARHAKPPRGTGRKNELYRYTPRMTDEELNEISKGSNVKVTPLFEKMLSASDAGKSGRLVLPKKCAEEFFPLINDAKGEPIVIQDSKGKDWDFIFRFWPNNNSRIYVLEGFEPYVKSMKLGEGDAVTFSRLVPEGKLVMGYRKFASASPTRQGMITATTSKMVSETKTMSNTRKPNGLISLQSDLVGAKVHVNTKRKGCEIVSTSKNIENENKMTEVIEGTRELVQSPRGSNFPSVMVEKVTGNNSNKGMVTANSNEGSDGKITPATTLSMFSKEKSTDPVNIQSDVMTANVPVGAKRKGCEIGPSSKTAENENKMSGIDLGSKEARELVQSTRDLGIKGNKDPKGMLLIGCQNDPINVQSGIIKADVPIQGKSKSCEIGSSSESTENEAKCQNAIKKHPRHRPGCLCIVCTQPGKKHPKTDLQTPPTPQAGNFLKPTEPGSSDQNDQMTVNSRLPKNRRKPWETESSSLNHQTMINSQLTNIPNPAELTSANSNYQTTVNGGSEDHQNANSFSGSDSKILPFDLNLPPETNGNFEDPMSPVQETTSGGNM